MHARLDGFERRPVHDPVEPPERTLAVEAAPAVEQGEVPREFLQAASIGTPFVEVAGQQGRPFLLRRLRQTSELPVIFLTSKDDEIDELFGLKMGADDFITKPFSQRLLVERVRAVLRRTAAREVTVKGEAGTQAQSIVRGNLILDQERHTCTWKDQPVTLTVTEFLILHALAQRPGVVKSRDSLMDAAYDDQVYVDDRTIDSHIKRLRKKFKVVDDSFDMIETLYGVGYRFRES